MVKNPTRYQLEKYDINQKIIRELVDFESRLILFSIRKKAKFPEEISREKNIPISTVYLRLHSLEDLALVYVEKKEISERGRKLKLYRSRINGAEIIFRKLEPQINLIPNKR